MQSNLLSNSDVRGMLQLMGEVGELPHDSSLRLPHLLDGLCSLIGGRLAAWFSTTWDESRKPHVTAVVDRGWTTRHEREVYFRYVNSDLRQDPLYQPANVWTAKSAPAQHTVLNWREFYSDNEWNNHAFVQELLRPTGLCHPIILLKQGKTPRQNTGITIFREWGDLDFGPRETQLLELVCASCNGLIDDHASSNHRLPPRTRQVLDRLLAGDSAKQIARHLGVSVHTINDHIKSIYRSYEVASRGELLAKFVRA